MENQNLKEIDMNELFPPQKESKIKKKKGRIVRSRGMKGFLCVLISLSFTIGISLLAFCDLFIGFSTQAVVTALSSLALWALLMVGMLAVSGKKPGENGIFLIWIDKIWIEILLLAAAVIITFALTFISESGYSWGAYLSFRVIEISLGIFVLLCWIILFVIILSIVRQLKAKNKNFACYRFSKQIIRFLKKCGRAAKRFVKELLNGKPFENKSYQKRIFYSQMIFVIGLFILFSLILISVWSNSYMLGGTLFLVFLCFAAFIALTSWYVPHNNQINQDMGNIVEQIYEIQNGNLHYHSVVSADSPLYEASQSLNSISEGFQKSVDQQIKSERMKIELVTNVSHDLKTPLTSIISYVDLLQKEENLSAEARDYVNILSKKSDRLKNIVEDLFSLAKVTSGNIEVEPEELDMTRLVIQTLADMDDRIQDSGHIIKTSIISQPAPIFADGKRMYRVLQNIIDNALKYALLGTRIFIDLKIESMCAVLTVKNTASYEMDFSEEEIMERFSRGDKARSTEGSGLGLSIAEGFTRACGGKFEIGIDGDQFKVQITFPLYKAAQSPKEISPEPEKDSLPSEAYAEGWRKLSDIMNN